MSDEYHNPYAKKPTIRWRIIDSPPKFDDFINRDKPAPKLMPKISLSKLISTVGVTTTAIYLYNRDKKKDKEAIDILPSLKEGDSYCIQLRIS